jgi:hypothetical protein
VSGGQCDPHVERVLSCQVGVIIQHCHSSGPVGVVLLQGVGGRCVLDVSIPYTQLTEAVSCTGTVTAPLLLTVVHQMWPLEALFTPC